MMGRRVTNVSTAEYYGRLMIDPAHGLFDSLDSWAALERLIDNGEVEGPYLECKTSTGIHLQQGHRAHLAQALSGFANTAGGVVIWGISTTRQSHSGLDVLTQLEPIGNCRSFRQQIDVAVPTLAYPAVEGCKTKTLHPAPGATKGAVLAYIPKTPGDPVQALGEKQFYLRTGAEFVDMPLRHPEKDVRRNSRAGPCAGIRRTNRPARCWWRVDHPNNSFEPVERCR
jgi:Putative DNA-binding domain